MLAQRSIPLAFADYRSPMIREVFDGQVAKSYSCATTKSTAILNYAVAPALEEDLVSAMKNSPFSILIDGSNDTGLEKMNPITVRIFDIRREQSKANVSTRWLSLATAVERTLKLYEGLRSYFLSEDESPRFKRLSLLFSRPVTEVYLLFYHAVLPVFTRFNLLLQREDPCIHILHSQCVELLRKLLSKFVKVAVIKEATHLAEIDYHTKENQLTDDTLFIGFTTKQKLEKLKREGEMSSSVEKKFFDGVRQYYEAATKYIFDKFPLNDDTLNYACSICGVSQQNECSFYRRRILCRSLQHSSAAYFRTVQCTV